MVALRGYKDSRIGRSCDTIGRFWGTKLGGWEALNLKLGGPEALLGGPEAVLGGSTHQYNLVPLLTSDGYLCC